MTAVSLIDGFSRPITYLRVSVTDKCNLRCIYCMPEGGLPWLRRDEILSYEEIASIVRAAASRRRSRDSAYRRRAARQTQPEPVDLGDCIGPGDRRHSAFDQRAAPRRAARPNSSPPACGASTSRSIRCKADRFEDIARRPGLDAVLRAIDAVVKAGLKPDEGQLRRHAREKRRRALGFAELTRERPIFVRFIEVMPVHENLGLQRDAYVSSDEILERISAIGELRSVLGPGGNGPARYFALPGAAGAVGVISPLSHDYCERCNRVRLTADGRLRLCLFGDHALDLRSPLRQGATTGRAGEPPSLGDADQARASSPAARRERVADACLL